MAINKNHTFQDLDGTPCAIVESKATEERMKFLKELLEFNGYKVIAITVAPPAPKPAPAANPEKETGQQQEPVAAVPAAAPPAGLPVAYTVGVTDVVFNATNAIFGRQLKTRDGHVVTLAYWLQQEPVSHDEVPYYEKKT